MSNNAATKVGSGGGVVTSVAATVPSDESVVVSPATGAVQVAITRNNQNANTFMRGPTSGVPGPVSFGPLVAADLPSALTPLSFDSYPAAPNAANDEFEAASLNGAWTTIKNTVAIADFSGRVQGSVWVKFTGNQGFIIGKAISPGVADFSVTVKGNFKVAAAFDAFNLQINDTNADLINTPGTANGNGLTMSGNGASTFGMQVNKFTAGVRAQFNQQAGNAITFASSGATAQPISTYYQGKTYLHVQRVGGVWTAWYSFDGETFMSSANWGTPPTYNTSFTPAFVVVSLESYGATSIRQASLDYVRFNWLFF